jgi:methenyltetrahydromethanopterin cyclohydrolase
LAVMDEPGNVIDRCELEHDDTTEAGEYFSNIGRAGIATVAATRNWYWLNDCLWNAA